MKRTLLSLLFALCAFFGAEAQIYQKVTGYGYAWDRVRPDSVLHLPDVSDTLSLKTNLATRPQLRVVGDSVWWYKGRWRNLSRGGFDSTSLSNRINLKLNISDTAAMLSPYGRVDNGADFRVPYFTGARTLSGSDSLRWDYVNNRLHVATPADYGGRINMYVHDAQDGIDIRGGAGASGYALKISGDTGLGTVYGYIDVIGRAKFYTGGSSSGAIGLTVDGPGGSVLRVNGDESIYIGEAGTAPTYFTRDGTKRYLYAPSGAFSLQSVGGNLLLGTDVDSSGYKVQIGGTSLLKGVAKYATNYGSLLDDRSLTHKRYVDSLVATKSFDTTTLSNRINLKLNISDTASMLSPYLRSASLSGYVPYTGATGNVNLGSNAITAGSANINGEVEVIGGNIGINSDKKLFLDRGYGGAYLLATGNGGGIRFGAGYNDRMVLNDGGRLLVGYLPAQDDGVNKVQIDGTARLAGLAGTGNRMVIASATGVLSTQAIPSVSGFVPYTGASQGVDLGTQTLSSKYQYINGNGSNVGGLLAIKQYGSTDNYINGYSTIGAISTTQYLFNTSLGNNNWKMFFLSTGLLTTNQPRTFSLPDADGILALKSDITGAVSGTTNYVSKFTASGAIGNSQIFDNGTSVLIGTSTEVIGAGKLQVNGAATFTGNVRTNDFIQIVKSSLPSLFLNNTVTQWQLYNNASNALVFNDGAADRVTFAYGGAASFSSSVTANQLIASNNLPQLDLVFSGNTAYVHSIVGSGYSSTVNLNTLTFKVANGANSQIDALILNGSGAATFSSSVTAAKLTAIGAASGEIISEDNTTTGSFVRILGDLSSNNLINWQTGTALRFATSTKAYGTFVERMRIDASGNVGIGTSSIFAKLQVNASGSGIQDALILENTNSASSNLGTALTFAGVGTSAQTVIRSAWEGASTSDAYMSFLTKGGGSVLERMRITSSGYVLVGNIPVPTTDLLQVAGSVSNNSRQNIIYSSYDDVAALFQRVGSHGAVIRLGRSGVSSSTTIDYPADGAFGISTAGSERMRITSSGRTLIGTSTDNLTDLLQVAGSVRATGNVVSNGGSFFTNDNGRYGWGAGTTYMDGDAANANIKFIVSNSERLRINTSGIQTSAPSGGTAQPWKLGNAGIAIGGSDGSAVAVEINGTVYYLMTAYLPAPAPNPKP